ncbi:hypothetical protein HSBAA_PA_0400 (plasmid) [Vreelandella sulfidaeris]|uniref:Uncharacterized protein n=1 Tax=Vreelandella sulfidaeris TaxID=115553 RepID=A0A455UI59_9GAMM|nr:hypothetical protein HSBAA_PA_0400 [Halomonas sulfidaeris]
MHGVLGNNLNRAVYTVVYDSTDPNGGMQACDEAYASIDNRLQTAAPALLNGMREASPFWLQQAAGSTALAQAALDDSFRWASGEVPFRTPQGLPHKPQSQKCTQAPMNTQQWPQAPTS